MVSLSLMLIQLKHLSQVKAVVTGLGAGLLRMFLHGCMPFLDIEVCRILPPKLKKLVKINGKEPKNGVC